MEFFPGAELTLCDTREKIVKLDAKERRFDLVVLGEEGHVVGKPSPPGVESSHCS